uniref:G protein-coupled receptor 179 n=1 Tax=Cavia porcellus TaxID=10141 RepID=H0W0E6_CAVPO
MGAGAALQRSPVWGLLCCCFLCGGALGSPRPLPSLPPLPAQTEPALEPVWRPLPGAGAALAFLYSGDAHQLVGANCSEPYEALGVEARAGLPPVLQGAAGTLAQAANFLNMLLQANDIRESSVEEDVEWYQALVRSVAEGDPRAYRALLTFNPPPGASHLPLALQATRMGAETLLQDLSGNRMQEESPAEDLDSFGLQKRVLTNDLRSLNSPKWPQGDGYVGDTQQVRLSPPFLDCQEGQLRPGWLVTLSATFYGLKPDLSPEVRSGSGIGVSPADRAICRSTLGLSGTHLCCVPLEGQGFILGQYLCRCRPGFFGASGSGALEEDIAQTTGEGRLLRCQPCPEGCTGCVDDTPCLVQEALALRAAVLACQACCMLAVFLSMVISYHRRWSKRIRASGVVLLEAILFGSLLLYFPVFILYFKPSVFRCIALRWVRLLGFVTVYGTITLKLYRVLQLFLSRSAQRGPHLGSGQLLRRLALLLLAVLGFLAVWTAGVLERGQLMPLVIRGHTPTGRHFFLCHHDLWDYIMVVAEVLLLCWGSFLCYATRAVPSAFHEPRYMSIALHNELLLSAAFHTARFMLVPSLHPDWTLVLFFLHTHSTVTATLALIFLPKFQKPGVQPHEEILDEVYEDELELQRSGSYLNSSIASAWSGHSLDPGDIRDELKKLYTQLEVRKTKEMAANNPHLPKKRGSSRQGLGRSFVRYLAEFPEALARQHSRGSSSLGCSSLPGSSRRRLLSSGQQDAEGSPALANSHSTCDQHQEQEPALLGSVLQRNLSRKALRLDGQEPATTEGPLALGFRSASAHNLTVSERLPRARPSSLQKSLSVVADTREKALLLASQAYLEETYWQAKERQERKRAEVAMASSLRRPLTRRPERAWGVPLSAPPSPAKSSSMDSSQATGGPQDEGGMRSPHPPIRHRVSSPILGLPGASLAEPRMLSPSSALAPVPIPALAPLPGPPQSPSLLTYICPWENTELPVKKENTAQKGISGLEPGSHSPAPARAKLWRALSVAVEKRASRDNDVDTKDGRPQGEAGEGDEDRPKIFSKSHSLKTPMQEGSMRSLGLAIKALTRSRSTYREKEGCEDGHEMEKGRATAPWSPRPGRPRAVGKQVALASCDDEESLQNQQNAHTSRMLQVLGKTGLATLRQVFGDKSAEQAKEVPVGRQEPLQSGLQLPGSADRRVAEACPWEVAESDVGGLDNSSKAQICPWEVSEGSPSGQQPGDTQEDKRTATGKSELRGAAAVTARKRPERLVRSQEAVCPWEGTDPRAVGSVDGKKPNKPQGEAPGTEARSPQPAKAELCPWEVDEGDQGTPPPGERELPREGQGPPKKAALWRGQKLDGGLESLCPWESTDFRGPLAVPLQASGSLGSSITEVCPWEAGDTTPDPRKADVCPWEVSEGLEDGTSGQAAKGHSEKAKEKMSAKRETRDVTSKDRPEVQASKQESVCPWESTDPGSIPPPPGAQNSERPQVISQSSGSMGSRAAEVCPWEVDDALMAEKAQICPWEEGAGAREKEDPDRGTEAPRKSPNAAVGEACAGSRPRETQEPGRPGVQEEVVCPQETSGPGDCQHEDALDTDRPGVGLQDLGSVGCRPTEVCLWEVQEAATSNKAKICPWEVNEGDTRKGSEQDTGSTPAPAGCWEETLEQGGLPALGRGVANLEAKLHPQQEAICPWEAQDLESSALDTKVSDLSLAVSAEATEKGTLKPDPQMGFPPEHKSQGKAPAWKADLAIDGEEQARRKSQSVCPRDNMVLEDSLSHPASPHPAQREASFQAPSSAGASAAHLCPWEASDPDVCQADSSAKAEVCPWEAMEKVPEKGASKQDGKGDPQEGTGRVLERPEPPGVAALETPEMADGRKLEAVCPGDRRDCGGLSPQLALGTSDVCRNRSEAAGHVRTRVAEMCPWEVEEVSSAKKAEVCPGELGPGAAREGALAQEVAGGSQGQGEAFLPRTGSARAEGDSSEVAATLRLTLRQEQDTVSLREGAGSEGLVPPGDALDTDYENGSCRGAGSVGTQIAELCQWEVTDPEGNKIRGTMADICPWEETQAPSEEPGLLALTVAQAENVPRAPEKSLCLPISFFPESKSSRPEGTKGNKAAGAGPQEDVRELQGASVPGPRTSAAPELSLQEAEAQKSSPLAEDRGQAASETQGDTAGPPPACPWD